MEHFNQRGSEHLIQTWTHSETPGMELCEALQRLHPGANINFRAVTVLKQTEPVSGPSVTTGSPSIVALDSHRAFLALSQSLSMCSFALSFGGFCVTPM